MDTPTTLRRLLVRGFLAVVVLCALYPLSYGPVFVVSYRTGCPQYTSLFRFYAPLWRVARATSMQDVFWSYRIWWVRSCAPADGYKYAPNFGSRTKGILIVTSS